MHRTALFRHPSARSLGALAVLLLTLAACSDGPTPLPAPVASVAVSPNTATVLVSGTRQLSATLRSAGGDVLRNRTIVWSSSDTSVATVSASGTVTARALGSAIISASSEGRSGQAAIIVTGPVASVQVVPGVVNLQVGGTQQLSATPVAHGGAPLPGLPVAWSSSDTLVAAVSATGMVTARGTGSATISASSEGVSGQATVNVAAASRTVASIDFDPTTAQIEEGEVLQLRATPRDAQGNPITGLGIQWRTSDEAIARLSLPAYGVGQVMGIRTGTVTITAKVHGKEASATVTVTASYPYDLLYAGVAGQSNVEIFRRDIRDAAGQPMRLLPANTPAGMPRPSPDGARIAFLAAVQGQPGIYVVNRDGSGLRAIVTAGSGSLGAFSWSPDGTRIAYFRRQAGEQWGQIWAANVDGEPNPVSLTADLGDARVRMPAWSPQLADGSSRIAYVHQINGVVARLWTMRPDGSDKRQITTGDFHDDYPAWSPDGETIVFERIGSGSALVLVHRTGGNVRLLYVGAGTSRQVDPAWSPDGKLIAFATRIQSHGEGGELYQIQTVWADGSKLARRTFSETTSRNPAWLPHQ